MTALVERAANFYTDSEPDARLAARREKKLQIAQLQLQQTRYEELLADYHDFNARIDAAAAEHQSATSAIQDTLSSVEEQIVALLADQKPIPPALEAERSKGLKELRLENEKLETTIAATEKLKRANEQQRNAIAGDTAHLQVEKGRLAQEPLGNPAMLFEKLIVESKQPFLVAWERRCAERVSIERTNAQRYRREMNNFNRAQLGGDAKFMDDRDSNKHVEKLQQIAAAAGAEVAAGTQRLDELHRLMIAE